MISNTIFNKFVRHTRWMYNSVKGYFSFSKCIDASTDIFISHNGDSAGGAPVVLFELMGTMKDERRMIFLCNKPGGIIQQCEDENIPAFSFYLLKKLYLNKIIKSNVKSVTVNTLASYDCINFFNKKGLRTPVLWWIHEERGLVERYKSKVPEKISDNVKVMCVSPSVQHDLIELCPQLVGKTEILHYGCKDLLSKKPAIEKNSEVFKISIIGRICSRKNQIQVVDAFNLLPDDIKKNIQVVFVAASSDEDYKKKLHEAIGDNQNFTFKGPINRKDMPLVYAESSLIVCPSIDDPLPVAITEAMMLKCPFITSSRTGQSDNIENGINGYSYEVEKTEDLSNLIKQVYENKDITFILENARKTYLRYFTPEIVKHNFIEVVNQRGVQV